MAKKIAEQLIDTLVESGVERIYAVTGDSLNEVNEAVRKNNKGKNIVVVQKQDPNTFRNGQRVMIANSGNTVTVSPR